MEKVIKHLQDENKVKLRYKIPDSYPFEDIRKLFNNPEVNKEVEIKFTKPNEVELV